MSVFNVHGKLWEEEDALYERVGARLVGSYAVYSACGLPLFGRVQPGKEVEYYIATHWSAANKPLKEKTQ